MKIYILLYYFMVHKQQSKRRRNTALKKKNLWVKVLPLLGANRLTPLLEWLHSCFVGGARTHSVKPGASSLLQPLAPRSWSAMAPGLGHRRLGWSLGVEPGCKRVWAAAGAAAEHIWVPPWTFLPPLSWCQGSLSLLAAPVAASLWGVWAKRSSTCMPWPWPPGEVSRCMFALEVLWAQPPQHGRVLQGMSSFSWHFTQLSEAQPLHLITSFVVFLAFLGKLLL